MFTHRPSTDEADAQSPLLLGTGARHHKTPAEPHLNSLQPLDGGSPPSRQLRALGGLGSVGAGSSHVSPNNTPTYGSEGSQLHNGAPHIPKDEKGKYEYYQNAIEASGGTFDLRPGQRNIMGIRGFQDGKLNDNAKNKYNDTMIVLWVDDKGQKHVHEYSASVDPGKFSGGSAKGDPNLMDGQYDYQLGVHHGKKTGNHEALVQDGDVHVWRDKNKDGKREDGEKDERGRFGINIHAGGPGPNVGHNSEGCQVIQGGYNGEQWQDFLKQIKSDPDNKFKYVLLDGTRLAGLEKARNGGTDIAANEHTKGINPAGLAGLLKGAESSLPTLGDVWQGVKGAWDGVKKKAGKVRDYFCGGPESAPANKAETSAPKGTEQPQEISNGEAKPTSHLSIEQLRHIVPGLGGKRAEEMIGPLNQAMELAGCNTPQRRAMFIAQLAHETGGFKWLHELGNHSYFDKYDAGTKKGRELGNTQPGDGALFKGRGFIHLTGRDNYEKAGKAIGEDLIAHPELAEDPKIAAKVAAWYWQNHTVRKGKGKNARTYHLNELADQGDFVGVTQGVNGGHKGLDSRRAYYSRASQEFVHEDGQETAPEHPPAGDRAVLDRDHLPSLRQRAWAGSKTGAAEVVKALGHWAEDSVAPHHRAAPPPHGVGSDNDSAAFDHQRTAPSPHPAARGQDPASSHAEAPRSDALAPELGTLSAAHESHGSASTVSPGKGDAGGASYGLYQMTSKSKGKVGGTVSGFVSHSQWAQEFVGLTPGSPDFTAKWRDVAARDPDAFRKAQHEYIKETHYDKQVNMLKHDLGFDVSARSNALQQVIWSSAVQHGPHSAVVEQALKGQDLSKLSDEEIIHLIYQERGRKDATGQLVHFSHNSAKVQSGVAQRFVSEEKDAEKLLHKEQEREQATEGRNS